MQFLDDFLENLLEFVDSKSENGQWLSLLFWVFVAARIVTCAERIIRKSFVACLFVISAILPQQIRAMNNWIMIFFHGEEQQGSQLGGWEWNGIKSPFKTDFEWFKNFKPVNSNDVLISTYPKAGTTWHQELIDLILHKGNMKRDDHWIAERAPYLDIAMCSQLFDSFAHNLQWDNVTLGKISGGIQAKINAEFPEARYHYKTHMIATHLPDHFLPSAKNESKTIFVVRNPFDVVISFHKWMTLFENNKNHPWYSDFDDMFEQFLNEDIGCGPFFDHIKRALEFQKLNPEKYKVLFFENAKADLAKQVEEMSKFLGTDLDDETIQKIAKHCTFANLKNVKSFDLSIQMKEFNDCLPFKIMRLFNPNIKTIARKTGGFMVSGKVGGWRNKLTISQAQRLHERCQSELSEYDELPNIMEYGKQPFKL